MNKSKKENQRFQTAKEFTEKNWPGIAAISGITFAGAALMLLFRFYKRRKAENGDNDQDTHLDALETDTLGRPEVETLLDLAPEARRAISHFDQIIDELKAGVTDERLREILDTIKNVK